MLGYLPPGRGDIPAFTPAEAGTRFSDPGGMQGSVDLLVVGVSAIQGQLPIANLSNAVLVGPLQLCSSPQDSTDTEGSAGPLR